MSSQGSLTPSTDSTASETVADLATLGAHGLDDEFASLKLDNRVLGASRLATQSKEETDFQKWQPVDYCGTLTRSLAYFGNFEVRPETKVLPWISDHTSGKVHEDMRMISMLFNENLTLPKEAETFIAQSAVLQEEARWERLKAAFYSFYPEEMKKDVFKVLSEMSPRYASQIIAKKTSRFENEVILIRRPIITDPFLESDSEPESQSRLHIDVEAKSCNERDAENLNKELAEIARKCKIEISSVLKGFAAAREKIAKHNSYV